MSDIQIRLNRIVASLCLLAMAVLISATSPADKIGYTMLFFLFLLGFLISFSHLLIGRVRGQVTSKNRYRILIISFSLVVLLMFRSAQSLGWLDGIVMIVVVIGLLFYSGRRA